MAFQLDPTSALVGAAAAAIGFFAALASQGPVARGIASLVRGRQAQPPAATPPEADAASLIAILTAAATVALGQRVVVRRITFINQNTVTGWAEAGRNSIHSSHLLRRGL